MCNDKIFLEYNYPAYNLKSAHGAVSLAESVANGICNGNNETLDDYDLIKFLDQETSRTSRRKLLNSANGSRTSYRSYLFSFDFSSASNGSNHNDNDDDDESSKEDDSQYNNNESDSDLNEYFSSGNSSPHNLMRKKKKKSKHKSSSSIQNGGKLGLDNLGNTCYQNAALQALSNCYALTSYLL